MCANANKIVDALSQFGIEVTSDNAKSLVRYISDCVGLNPATLEPKNPSTALAGWAAASRPMPRISGMREIWTMR